MSSCLLPYLGGVLDHAAMISCGSDAVTDPVTGWIISSKGIVHVKKLVVYDHAL